MEELTASEVRARSFGVVVRGFDRGEVERYLELVADYLEALQQQLHQLGVTEVGSPTDVTAEYTAVGDEVASVLAEARAAADAMRSRAVADTAQWRAETEAEVLDARESVWVTGTQMLEQVIVQCDIMLTEARESSLRVRSEAERDSSRMLTDAQREREELVRSGRDEAERMVSSAKKEADALMMGARHQADVAQERARALEERRAELMEELESAQKALLGIEDEPAEPDAVEEEEQEAAAESTETPRSHWPEDDGGVRVVAARPSVVAEPVDADALAAEVEALRDKQPAAVTPPNGGEAQEPPPSTDVGRLPSPPKGEEREPKPVDETEEAPKAEPDPEPEPAEEPAPDPLAGLFDELRGSESASVAPASGNGSSPEEPEPAAATVAMLDKPEPAPVEAPEVLLDPFALRDRLLLPVQNRALRLVKRELVAAQNRALEELRLDAEWTPAHDLIDDEISGVLIDLITESTAAGVAAAGELLGRTDPPAPELEVGDPTDELIGAFVEAAGLSLERSRLAGAGKRETASSLSRIFRAWRTDDAERRVRFLSQRAYHGGVLAALEEMGCERVLVSPAGTSCIDHGEGSVSFRITDGPPPGTLVPPASLECSCTIVPDC